MGNLPTKWASDRAFDLADKYLTRYFKGFDTSQVRLGCAGGGAIELGPLEMRPEAFRHSDNAIEIKAGYIGKLHIRLPNLHELATGPFTVRVQGVYILLGLASQREWDEEAERKSKRSRHQAAIAAAEQLLHNLQRGFDAEELASRFKGLDAFFGKKRETFAIRKLLQLIANIRLDIQDVMIVLDEDRLMPSHPFALGLIVRSIEVAPETQGTSAREEATTRGTRGRAKSATKSSEAAESAAAPSAAAPSGSAAAAAPEEGVIRKTVAIKGLSFRIAPRESALPMEFLAAADIPEIFNRIISAAMQASLPLLDFDQGVPQVHLVINRGAALERSVRLHGFCRRI